jgi:ATP-binding cassette, subfamily F, member 3
MLQVQHLRKSYGPATILADITFLVNDSERVGLIGPNGTGKSTILRCLTGLEQPDSGIIVLSPPEMAIGYLPQAFADLGERTVAAVLAEAQAELHAAEQALARAGEALAASQDMDTALADYDAALARFEALGGYEREHRAAAVMEGLGLGAIDPAAPAATLSGGQKTRLGLATLLLREPDLLLLDEPTNHLDVTALEWLERFVQSYPRAVLIVSHDREFLDRTATRILYLDPETRTIKSYPGNYSDFAAARAHERELHAETWQKQQEYIAKVESDIARLKGQALSVELTTTPRQPNVRRLAKKVAKKAKSRERKLERYLESDERVEKPTTRWGLKLDFGPPPPGGRAVLRLEDVSFGYPTTDHRPPTTDQRPPTTDHRPPTNDEEPRIENQELRTENGSPHPPSPIPHPRTTLLNDVSFEVQHGERIVLVGPNGAGKTTLLRLIEGKLEPTTGQVRLGANIRLGVMAQEQETLDTRRTVLETVLRERSMSETEARNFLHFFLFGGDSVFRPIGACSLGERSRLQLALLVLRGCNLLLLDEPLNHLDIEGREHFEAALEAFEGTIIAVAHDRAFLRSFAERVVEVRDGRARVFEGDYEYYLEKREQ